MEPTKKDWKLYRERIGDWQEAYMEKLVQKYVEYLQENLPASDKFWELENRIKNDKKKPGVLIEVRKSSMIWDIVRLIHVAGITDWRKYFITVPEIMDSLHKYTDGRASERYVRFEGKYIFLMGSTRLYGWNEEYYSYALYCLLKKLPNASVKYNQAKGWEDVDCHIELTSSTNAGKWKIKYLRAKDKFSVIDASGVQSLYSTVEDAKYALEKLL